MKFLRIYNIIAILACFFSGSVLLAQNDCGTATQFCTGTLDPFPAVVGQPSTGYPVDNNNYGCLITQPNRTWYTMTMANDGDVRFTLNNSAGIDIDFAVWGPFPNAAAANAACGNLGNGGATGSIVDCSYATYSSEAVELPNVLAGQVYIMLVTNYNGGATNIFTQNNTGTADFLCDCNLEPEFGLSSLVPNNTGVLVSTDTVTNGATYLICAPVTPTGNTTNLGISVRLGGANISDTLSVFASGTTVDQVFPNSFNLVPLSTRNDSIEVVIWLQILHQHIGTHRFYLSILSKSVDGSTCITRMPITVVVPGVEILAMDTTLCPAVAHDIQMDSRIITAGIAGGTGTYSWVQTLGPLTTPINDTTAVSPIISIPANTSNGDIFSYALTYQDPTGCITSDSINIVMINRAIDLELTADRTTLCNNGEDQTVQLNIEVEDNPYIVVNNGTFTWNTTQYLTNANTANPIATLSGLSANDSFTYILNYAYGTCTGSDTLTLNFYNTAINALPAIDTLCVGEQLQLNVVITDSIKVPRLDCTTYNVENITYAPVAFTAPNSTSLAAGADAAYTTAIPIGFPFNFYCTDYQNVYASSDGFLSFNALSSSYGTNTALPAVGTPNNILAFAWDDLKHDSSKYETIGVAPFRQFVYSYYGYRYNTTTNQVRVQVILYETTNVIEYHITSINPLAVTTNSMTQGIENATGTAATVVTGRNNTSFSTTNSAVRFYPRTVMDVAPIAYNWIFNDVLSANNNNIATPTGMVVGQGNMYVEVTAGGCLYRDSLTIFSEPVLPAPVISCGVSTNNSVQFVWDAIPGAVIYEYTLDGGNTWIGVVDPQVTIGGLAGGSTVEVQVRGVANTGLCALGLPATYSCTALDCDIRVTPVVTHKQGCLIDETLPNNGQIVFNVVGGNTSLEYNFAGTVSTDNTFSNLDAGTYEITITKAGDSACFVVQTVVVEDHTQDVRLNANVAGINTDTISLYVDNLVVLDAGFNNSNTTYNWSGPIALDPASGNHGSFVADTAGEFLFEVTATAGACTNTDRIVVRIQDFGFTGMPTAFTPNGDGENDLYRPVGLHGAEFKTFIIYNRWGHKVFETSNINEGWDGKVNGADQPRDIYVYYIEFKLPNESGARELRGEFTLLR